MESEAEVLWVMVVEGSGAAWGNVDNTGRWGPQLMILTIPGPWTPLTATSTH